MRGIILAAGKGRRLEEVLKGKPKCLLKLGEKSLLQRQVEAMQKAGITEVVVVVGFEKQQVMDAAAKLPQKFHFVENPIYEKTNTLYSLWLARRFFDEDFIYFNGDILCDFRTVRELVTRPMVSRLACVRHACGDEEVKVLVRDGRITSISKQIDPAACFGEFTGVARFCARDNLRFSAILDDCAKDESLWGRYFEHAVDILAAETNLACADITGLPVTEIDFPQDLINAEAEVLPRLMD